jgi:hypothetical protein
VAEHGEQASIGPDVVEAGAQGATAGQPDARTEHHGDQDGNNSPAGAVLAVPAARLLGRALRMADRRELAVRAASVPAIITTDDSSPPSRSPQATTPGRNAGQSVVISARVRHTTALSG